MGIFVSVDTNLLLLYNNYRGDFMGLFDFLKRKKILRVNFNPKSGKTEIEEINKVI